MVRVTQERLRELLATARNTRHVAVVGDGDDGATLVDTLVNDLGGTVQVAADDADGDYAEPFSLATSLSITPVLFCDGDGEVREGVSFLINLIQAHGLLDCSADLDAALALSDAVLVVVDCIDGVSLRVETALKKAAIAQKPVYVLVSGLEKHCDASDFVAGVNSVINASNAILRRSCLQYETFGSETLDFSAGNVVIGSIVGKWAFSPRLPFSASGGAVSSIDSFDGAKDKHGNVLAKAINFIQAVDLETGRRELNDVHLEQFSPLGRCIARLVSQYVSSPLTCQQHLIDQACADKEWAVDVAKCDQRGGLIVQVVRLVSLSGLSGAVAVGRVLSGKASSGQDVHVITHSRVDPQTNQLRYPSDSQHVQVHSARISRVGMFVGREALAISPLVPAGNLCVLFGVDDCIDKTAIVTTCKPDAIKTSVIFHRFVTSFLPQPVIRTTLEPQNDATRIQLIQEMLRIGRIDLGAECYVDDSGELVVAGTSEEHLNASIERIRDHVGERFTVREPYLCYRETVTTKTPSVCMAKSPNKNIRLYCTAEPLSEALAQDLALPALAFLQPRDRQTRLTKVHGWSDQDATHVTSIDRENILVDNAPQLVHSHLLIGPMLRGFKVATALGVLCEEPLHGVRVNVHKIWMFGSERHWGPGQALVALRRATLACELTSSPALLEPVELVEISCASGEQLDALQRVIADRRGQLVRVNKAGTKLRVHVPVAESVGLLGALQTASASPCALSLQRVVDHFARVEGDPLDAHSRAGALVRQLRTRKHLDPELPPLRRFRDEISETVG